MKLLLEDSLNAQDLLRLTRFGVVPYIRFEQMTRVGGTFVQRDYRHVECDVVLTAPLRHPSRPGRSRSVLIYVLIEHQSEPETLMPLRVLEYVVQIYRYQEREWRRRGESGDARLSPVLPVVFYTGTRRWEGVGEMANLVEAADLFGDAIPSIRPVFVNLSELDAERLVSEGGWFGRLLHIVQQRHARLPEFERLLREELTELERMRPRQPTRWLELLSYLMAMVYHDRAPGEQPPLREMIEESIPTEAERREVSMVAKSMADVHRDEGRKQGEKKGEFRALRRTLLRQLQERFGALPAETERAVRAADSVKQLEEWLTRFARAESLDEVGIDTTS